MGEQRRAFGRKAFGTKMGGRARALERARKSSVEGWRAQPLTMIENARTGRTTMPTRHICHWPQTNMMTSEDASTARDFVTFAKFSPKSFSTRVTCVGRKYDGDHARVEAFKSLGAKRQHYQWIITRRARQCCALD